MSDGWKTFLLIAIPLALICIVVQVSAEWGVKNRTPDGMEWHEHARPGIECIPANGGRYDYGYYCLEATPDPIR